MPYRDQTGPWGQGPATGWGRGSCGRGLARQRGFGRRFFTAKEEVKMLEDEEKNLQEDLQALRDYKQSLQSQK